MQQARIDAGGDHLVRRLPAPGPLRVTMHATDITAGRMDETAQAWDATGNLVAQATQLAAVRT